ncbi:MAG TPA: cadherin-like beta sandwich domain-containing protein, partial [Polyangiales bacterium]|nr:cadherin-like beta sandwich domain-containing protein [Polyangiales bacterium]
MCNDGKWTAQASCGTTERCETTAGPGAGLCTPIATLCLTHDPGEEFCDGEVVRTCRDLVLSEAGKCSERRRCTEIDGVAECVCATGWVDFGTGAGCERPTSCATDNGGCDLLTQCSVQGTETICSVCPEGYEGAGKTGCSAQLTALQVEGGTLSPLFSPDNHSYRISLPLTQQQLRVTTLAATGVTVDIDNVAQEPSAPWVSPPLALGEHKFTINLSTSKDVKSSYELIVTRTGAQEAYLKAEAPETDAEFGMNVAVWGDTVVVGSIYEDGSREDPLDKSTSNSGGAYVFVRDANGNWSQQAHLKGNPTRAGDYFGFGLALYEDTLAV